MKITFQELNSLTKDSSDNNITFEKFKSKKRKYSSIKNLRKLMSEDGSGDFSKSDLEELRSTGIIDELSGIIKSGKEASVYLAKSDNEHYAVKIYTDLRVRSFRKDDIYRQGRFIGDARIEKAINQGSEFGINAHQILWVSEEFRQLKFLFNAGVPVPRPIASCGLVVVMEFIGDSLKPAPRISDLKLEKSEAEFAFSQSLEILERIVLLGRVHGDFSAYNLLWHNHKAIAIDFPQVVKIESNAFAREILFRDVNSLCKSFARQKVISNPEKIYSDLLFKIRKSGFEI